MSTVDVLAYLDALVAQHAALSADAYHAQELPKAEAARAAVAELIEAANSANAKLWEMAQEFSRPNFSDRYGDGPDMRKRSDALRAALARCKGAQ